jgi:hypothetical protein
MISVSWANWAGQIAQPQHFRRRRRGSGLSAELINVISLFMIEGVVGV